MPVVTAVIGNPPGPYRVRARNTSTASENRIHHDDVAAAYGFRGGLVPGVAVYAYMTRPAVEAFGRDWAARGTMAARFVQPFYEDDEVVVASAPRGAGALDLKATRGQGGEEGDAGEVCATGRATLPPPGAVRPPDVADFPLVPTPPPAERPPATAEVLRGLPGLCVPAVGFHADRAATYLADIGDDHPLFREEGIAHPGWLIRLANTVLSANVRLGPWIHTSSEATYFRPVVDGDQVSTRARVADVFERKGHSFVTLDVLVLAGEVAAMHAVHTAIYSIAPRQ